MRAMHRSGSLHPRVNPRAHPPYIVCEKARKRESEKARKRERESERATEKVAGGVIKNKIKLRGHVPPAPYNWCCGPQPGFLCCCVLVALSTAHSNGASRSNVNLAETIQETICCPMAAISLAGAHKKKKQL